MWVVVPTYNEAANIERIIAGVRSALTTAALDGFRILVVDDGSPDGTGAIARSAAAAQSRGQRWGWTRVGRWRPVAA